MTRAGSYRAHFGFMLIELLVVISVIAVLAGIVMVGYSSIQNRTFDSAVQSDLASNAKILTEVRANRGDFPTGAELATLSPKLGFVTNNYDVSGNAVLYCHSTNNVQMSLIAKSKTGTTYYVTNRSRTPEVLGAYFPQGGAIDCPNSGLPAGSSFIWIHTSASGWVTWVR